jgi:hypothetical protein
MKIMRTSRILISLTCLSLLINYSFGQLTPQQAITQMGRGINIGNTMDCPTEGSWGNGLIKEYYFDDYKAAGFTNIRIPITWQGHTATTAPYAINAAWMNRVEQVVDWGLKRGLIITINAHHDGFIKDGYATKTNRDRFDSIWSQIATRFKDKSDSLFFEIINEPKGLTEAQINELNVRELSIIRKTNPTRIVIFSGNEWSSVDRMIATAIPPNDTNLMAYFHSYDPYPFGLEGTGSYSSDADVAGTKKIFDNASAWSTKNKIPVIIGEFGAIRKCAYNARMFCYASVTEQSLAHNIAFDAWDDGGDFLIYKRSTRKWNEIKDVLIYTYKESPTKLTIAQPVSDSIILKWTNRTTVNDSIVVERKMDINGEFDTIATIGSTMNTFIDTNVTIGKTYYYRLQTNISDSIYPMSYPIAISRPYFKIQNPDTTVSSIFAIKLQKASDPDVTDSITYKLTQVGGSKIPKWITFDYKTVTFQNNKNAAESGIFPMVLTATDRAGHVDTDTFNLTVVFPQALNEIADQSGIHIYPIPASESIQVLWSPLEENIELSLIDYLGRNVLSKKIDKLENRTDCEINISNVPSGVYILKLSTSKIVLNKKIVVNK